MGAAGAASDGYITSINPATGEVLGRVPDLGPVEVAAAIERAKLAQPAWAQTPIAVRCRKVARFADVLMARAEEVIELLVNESGKTRFEALAMEVAVVADLVRYFAKHAPQMLAPESIPLHLLKHRASYLHYVPRGVVGIIAPWNFPLAIPIGETMMALIAGNAVVLKPSEIAPLIAVKAAELSREADLPADLFQVVTGRAATGAALIAGGPSAGDAGARHSIQLRTPLTGALRTPAEPGLSINYCIFTGSVATGKKVAAACSERLIPYTLELGGKAPAVVCSDADLDRAAQAIAWGGFAHSGQVCASVERVYATVEIHDALVAKLVEHASQLRQGDGTSHNVDVGAMTWDRQLAHVERLVAAAISQGAEVAIGGRRKPGPGMFFEPTVITNCRPEMEIMTTEIFGPVIPIMRVPDEEQAVRYANESHLGLLAYVFTRDRERGKRLAERIAAGTVMVNDVLTTYACPETPWGGVKQSGIGRTHSVLGLRDLCEIRHVNYDRLALRREAWWYPYKQATFQAALRGARLLFGKHPWRRYR